MSAERRGSHAGGLVVAADRETHAAVRGLV